MKSGRVIVVKNYLVIRKNGERINLFNKSGKIVKKTLRKTYVEFTEGTFPVLNVALKKEAK